MTIIVIYTLLASFEMKQSHGNVDREHICLVIIRDAVDFLNLCEGTNVGDCAFVKIYGADVDVGDRSLGISPSHSTTGVYPHRVIRMEDALYKLVVAYDVGGGTAVQ